MWPPTLSLTSAVVLSPVCHCSFMKQVLFLNILWHRQGQTSFQSVSLLLISQSSCLRMQSTRKQCGSPAMCSSCHGFFTSVCPIYETVRWLRSGVKTRHGPSNALLTTWIIVSSVNLLHLVSWSNKFIYLDCINTDSYGGLEFTHRRGMHKMGLKWPLVIWFRIPVWKLGMFLQEEFSLSCLARVVCWCPVLSIDYRNNHWSRCGQYQLHPEVCHGTGLKPWQVRLGGPWWSWTHTRPLSLNERLGQTSLFRGVTGGSGGCKVQLMYVVPCCSSLISQQPSAKRISEGVTGILYFLLIDP